MKRSDFKRALTGLPVADWSSEPSESSEPKPVWTAEDEPRAAWLPKRYRPRNRTAKREKRLALIGDLIEGYWIGSLEELRELLAEFGHPVSITTISYDLDELAGHRVLDVVPGEERKAWRWVLPI